MLAGLRFHHIGYVTDSIADTSAEYLRMGYEASPICLDEIQRVNICFMSRGGGRFPMIELVEPTDERSSVNKLLKKNGVSPYHVCYEVDNIEECFVLLTEQYGFIPLFRPVEAAAFGNRLICYLYKKEIGFVELVNK